MNDQEPADFDSESSARPHKATDGRASAQLGERPLLRLSQRLGVAISFTLVLALLALDALFSYRTIRQLDADARLVSHTLEALDAIQAAQVEAASLAASWHELQLASHGQFRQRFEASKQRLQTSIERITALTADNPAQQQRVPAIRQAGAELTSVMEAALVDWELGRKTSAEVALVDPQIRAAGIHITSPLEEMETEERRLLGIREVANAQTYSAAIVRILLTGVCAFLIVGAFVGLVRRHILARETVAQALQEQRELLHATLAGIGDGVIATDVNGRVSFMNPIAEQLTAWQEAEAIGRDLDDVCVIVNEATRIRVFSPALRALAENRIQGLANHSVLIAKDGNERPIDDSAAPIRSLKGNVTGAVFVFRDITERRHKERELADREQQIRLLLDSTAEAIYGVDRDGRCTFCNAACLKLMGYERLEDVLGREMHELLSHRHCDGREISATESRLSQILRDGLTVHADDEIFCRHDGTSFPVEYRGYPIHHDGALQGAVVSFSDITARRAAERAQAERDRLVALRAAKSVAMARDTTLPEALHELMVALVECLHIAMARIWMLDDSGKMLQLIAHCHATRSADELIRQVPVGHHLVGTVAETQRPLILENIQDDPRVGDPAWVKREEITSFAGYPLIVDHRLSGVLVLFAKQPLAQSVLTELLPLADGIAQFVERKRAEERVKESEERVRLAIDAADIGTWDYDIRSDLMDWSVRCKTIFGLPSDARTSYDDFLNRLHEEDRSRVAQLIQSSLKGDGDGDYQTDFRVVWPDGSIHWVAARGKTYFDDIDGSRTAVRFVGTVIDISQRVLSIETIRQRSEQLQRLTDVARQLTSANDVQSILRVVTDGARRVIGAQRAITRYCRDGVEAHLLTSPTDHSADDGTTMLHIDRISLDGTEGNRERILQMTHEVLETQNAWNTAEEETRLSEGRLVASLVRLNGTIVGDIQISDHADHHFTSDDEAVLIQLAQMASLAIEKARLYEQTQASDRRKDDFLAMLGHELRNPLSGIVSGVDAMGMLPLSDDARELQAIIGRQSAHMTRIVDDLLDVSRIARGKLTLRPEAVDFTALVSQVVQDYRRSQLSDGCEIIFELPQQPIWVSGDRTRLVQILANVIHNGCKFSDGPNTVTVMLAKDPLKAVAELKVSDCGIGMTAATLAHMFEPFNQADTSVERSRGGLGLGLALVWGLVKLHGGEISAQSEGLGCGSQFLLRFPAIEPPALSIAAPVETTVHRSRVLLIDDRRDAIAPVEKMLRLDGHEVTTANDGPTGVTRAREFIPEVVLCDIGLAGSMNGYEVVSALRAIPALQNAYFVAVTGYGQDEDRSRAKTAGFDYHVTKPVSKEQLRHLLAHHPRFPNR